MRLPKKAHLVIAFSILPAQHLSKRNLTLQAKVLKTVPTLLFMILN